MIEGGEVVTVDTLVEGVHFGARLSAADVGFKAVAASVSDLASSGARPRWMLLALSLPPDPPVLPWVRAFARGLAEACTQFGVYLIGGDVTGVPAGGPRFVCPTLAGIATSPMLRSTARPGDVVWVTGQLGLAGAGWSLDEPPPEALARLRRPQPPLSFALALAASGLATAAMDLSDGLAADLPRLAWASGVQAVIDPARLPLSDALAGCPDPLALQLSGGEDYELLFTSPPGAEPELAQLALEHGVQATPIGALRPGRGAILIHEGGDPLPWPEPAFDHFGRA